MRSNLVVLTALSGILFARFHTVEQVSKGSFFSYDVIVVSKKKFQSRRKVNFKVVGLSTYNVETGTF